MEFNNDKPLSINMNHSVILVTCSITIIPRISSTHLVFISTAGIVALRACWSSVASDRESVTTPAFKSSSNSSKGKIFPHALADASFNRL